MTDQKSYLFFTDNIGYEIVEIKGSKKYYVTGYISTKDKDILNDIVTDEALEGMLNQLSTKNIKLDVEHEAWREENPTIIPIGRIIEAKRDEKGIFVKAELNKANNRFNEVWNSIKEGFLDAFSIAYKTISSIHQTINGEKVRMLNKLDLLNVAITGNPVNPEAKMVNVFTKSLHEMEENSKMVEEIKLKDSEVKEEKTVEEKTEETPEEETEEELPAKEELEEKEEDKIEEKSQLMKTNKEMKEKLEKLEAEVKGLKLKLEKPIMKSKPKSLDEAELKSKMEVKNPLDSI